MKTQDEPEEAYIILLGGLGYYGLRRDVLGYITEQGAVSYHDLVEVFPIGRRLDATLEKMVSEGTLIFRATKSSDPADLDLKCKFKRRSAKGLTEFSLPRKTDLQRRLKTFEEVASYDDQKILKIIQEEDEHPRNRLIQERWNSITSSMFYEKECCRKLGINFNDIRAIDTARIKVCALYLAREDPNMMAPFI